MTVPPVRFQGNRVFRVHTSSDWEPRGPHTLPYFQIFGDREVFCLVNKFAIQLWFFNTNFAPDPRDWNLWVEEFPVMRDYCEREAVLLRGCTFDALMTASK